MRRKKVFFEELQRSAIWVWALLSAICLPFLVGSIMQIVFGIPFGDKPMSDAGLLIATLLILLFSVTFTVFCKLHTIINSEGIYYRYLPFFRRYKFADWEEIESYSIIGYNPMGEYGGWGLRKSRDGTAAYTVKGNMGLKICLKNGKAVLIGTQRPDYLKKILDKLEKKESYKGW